MICSRNLLIFFCADVTSTISVIVVRYDYMLFFVFAWLAQHVEIARILLAWKFMNLSQQLVASLLHIGCALFLSCLRTTCPWYTFSCALCIIPLAVPTLPVYKSKRFHFVVPWFEWLPLASQNPLTDIGFGAKVPMWHQCPGHFYKPNQSSLVFDCIHCRIIVLRSKLWESTLLSSGFHWSHFTFNHSY